MTRRASRGVARFIVPRMTRSGLWKPFCMRCERGGRDPEEVKKEVEAAGEAFGRAVEYCIEADDVDAARMICRVMGVTDKTPAGSKVVEFLQEKAGVLSWAERGGAPRPRRYGSCYGGIIKASGELYEWLYEEHPGVLTGEAGKAVTVPEGQADEAKPASVMTARAQHFFAKAIEAGLMEKTDRGYKWAAGKASLSYFLECVYDPDGCRQIPYKALEVLFGETRLAVALSQAMTAKKPQRWRERIDSLFRE